MGRDIRALAYISTLKTGWQKCADHSGQLIMSSAQISIFQAGESMNIHEEDC
jgi:hypothetical protein